MKDLKTVLKCLGLCSQLGLTPRGCPECDYHQEVVPEYPPRPPYCIQQLQADAKQTIDDLVSQLRGRCSACANLTREDNEVCTGCMYQEPWYSHGFRRGVDRWVYAPPRRLEVKKDEVAQTAHSSGEVPPQP